MLGSRPFSFLPSPKYLQAITLSAVRRVCCFVEDHIRLMAEE